NGRLRESCKIFFEIFLEAEAHRQDAEEQGVRSSTSGGRANGFEGLALCGFGSFFRFLPRSLACCFGGHLLRLASDGVTRLVPCRILDRWAAWLHVRSSCHLSHVPATCREFGNEWPNFQKALTSKSSAAVTRSL